MQGTQVWSLGQEDFLEKRKNIHSNILAWRIPWTKESGRLQSIGSQRVGHDWATKITQSCPSQPIWLGQVLVEELKIFHLCFSMSDLVPWPGVEPRAPALSACSLSHWTTREVLLLPSFDSCESCYSECGVQISSRFSAFSSFGCLCRNRIAGSHGNSM